MALGLLCACILAAFCTPEVVGQRLSVSGRHFKLGQDKVFLSGANLAWINYAYDFGNNQWKYIKPRFENQMKWMSESGGNTLRIWVHIQGESSPQFNRSGYVVGTEYRGTFINDFMDMLDLAKLYNVLIIPALWNGAVDQDKGHRLDGLITDTSKLKSYIDIVLKPLVKRVNGHPALGAWEIMNEPEGLLKGNVSDSDACFDSRSLKYNGVGWAEGKYNFRQLLRFINLQAAAIKEVDPKALVTVGVWNAKSNIWKWPLTNHYSDECLIRSGGESKGVLDFWQFHTYSWHHKFDNESPFKNTWWSYKTDRPIVVGEFDEREGAGMSSEELFKYAYENGYAGALSWQLIEDGDVQRKAMAEVRWLEGNGKFKIDLRSIKI